MIATALPTVSSLWVHRKNGRTVRVVGIKHAGDRDALTSTIEYQYLRGIGAGVGFKRGVTTTQTLAWADWSKFFEAA